MEPNTTDNDNIIYAMLVCNSGNYDSATIGVQQVSFLIPSNNMVMGDTNQIIISASTQNQNPLEHVYVSFKADYTLTERIQVINQTNCTPTTGKDYVELQPFNYQDRDFGAIITIEGKRVEIRVEFR